MEKRKMTVNVGGKPYTLVSTDPPEYIRRVATFVDRKLNETMAVTKLPSAQAAVLTCFNLAEDLLKAQDENMLLRRQMEIAAEESGKKEIGSSGKEKAEQKN